METTTFKPKDEVLNFMPAITFKNGVLEITGRAVSANSKYVFDPILWELYLYSLKPKDITIINIHRNIDTALEKGNNLIYRY